MPQLSTCLRTCGDIIDDINTRITWLSAIANLLEAHSELKPNCDCYPDATAIGHTGWLMTHLLGEIDGLSKELWETVHSGGVA